MNIASYFHNKWTKSRGREREREFCGKHSNWNTLSSLQRSDFFILCLLHKNDAHVKFCENENWMANKKEATCSKRFIMLNNWLVRRWHGRHWICLGQTKIWISNAFQIITTKSDLCSAQSKEWVDERTNLRTETKD